MRAAESPLLLRLEPTSVVIRRRPSSVAVRRRPSSSVVVRRRPESTSASASVCGAATGGRAESKSMQSKHDSRGLQRKKAQKRMKIIEHPRARARRVAVVSGGAAPRSCEAPPHSRREHGATVALTG